MVCKPLESRMAAEMSFSHAYRALLPGVRNDEIIAPIVAGSFACRYLLEPADIDSCAVYCLLVCDGNIKCPRQTYVLAEGYFTMVLGDGCGGGSVWSRAQPALAPF